jgi:hypothetical protein
MSDKLKDSLGRYVFNCYLIDLGSHIFSLFYYNFFRFYMVYALYFYNGVSFKPLFIGFSSLWNSDFGWSELFGGQGVFWFL